MHGPDETFVRFLCETVHPVVRSDPDTVDQLVRLYNEKLAADGWSLVVTEEMSGRPVFEGRRRSGAKQPSTALRLPEYQRLRDPKVFEEHLRRIETGLVKDPAAAIASSKEMVESACKIVLDDYGVEYRRRDELLDLYKKTAAELNLSAESVPDNARGSQAAQGALRALVTTAKGSPSCVTNSDSVMVGPGRAPALARHARLAFTTASAVAEFLLDTWQNAGARRVSGPSAQHLAKATVARRGQP
jgi:AbiJ N-terminal domain 3